MLTHRDRLAGTVVDARLHTAARASDLRVSRFGLVIDDHGHECGAVSDRYKLVRNADLVAAVDLTSDKMGLDLECESGRYRHGRSKYEFLMSDEWKVPGDSSPIRSRFTLGNGYGGTQNVTGQGGTWRQTCSNGQGVGILIASMAQRHVGEFNILELVEDLMLQTVAEMTNEKTRAILQGNTKFEWDVDKAESMMDKGIRSRNHRVMVAVSEDTPKKYQRPLVDTALQYREDVGHTVWAVTQAIAEIATHDRKNTPTAQSWARRNQVRILEAVGV